MIILHQRIRQVFHCINIYSLHFNIMNTEVQYLNLPEVLSRVFPLPPQFGGNYCTIHYRHNVYLVTSYFVARLNASHLI